MERRGTYERRRRPSLLTQTTCSRAPPLTLLTPAATTAPTRSPHHAEQGTYKCPPLTSLTPTAATAPATSLHHAEQPRQPHAVPSPASTWHRNPRHVTHHTTRKDRRPHHNARGTTIMTTAPPPGHITRGMTDCWTQYRDPTPNDCTGHPPCTGHPRNPATSPCAEQPPPPPPHAIARPPPCCCHPVMSPPHRERPNARHDTMT
ncbi:hypothetical protein DXG01_009905, partial [Tephrocybe rancida]